MPEGDWLHHAAKRAHTRFDRLLTARLRDDDRSRGIGNALLDPCNLAGGGRPWCPACQR